VACAHEGEPWLPDFVRAVFAASFAHDRDPADPRLLTELLDALGQPADPILASAGGDGNKAKLRLRTQEAARHGIFGAPSFRVDGELYWGNDRLEMALDHAAE
jgi:2-hydroxychromene-2-carboxylate isomerase